MDTLERKRSDAGGDRDGNGSIDADQELFGNAPRAHGTSVDGFADLARYDDNGDETIDQADLVFDALQIWYDRDCNGISAAHELKTLADVGVSSLDTTGKDAGNRPLVFKIGSFVKNGQSQTLFDVLVPLP